MTHEAPERRRVVSALAAALPQPHGVGAAGALTPTRILLLLAASYAVAQTVTGAGVWLMARADLLQALAVWLLASGMVVPFAMALSELGQRVDRVVLGGTRRGGGRWAAAGLGGAWLAHWVAATGWPLFTVAFQGFTLGRLRSGEEWAVALVGLWTALALGVMGLVWGVRRLHRTPLRPTHTASLLPTSVWIGLAYASAWFTATLLGVAWLSEAGWWSSGGLWAVAAWAWLGAGASAGTAGLATLWTRSLAMARTGNRPASEATSAQLEAAGAVWVAHWLPVFGIALTPAVDLADLRWMLLGLAFAAVLAGTWMWALGRTRHRLVR